jgi:hypothetical protein
MESAKMHILKMRKQHPLIIIALILLGIAILAVNSQGVLQTDWAKPWLHWIALVSALVLITTGVILWIMHNWHNRQEADVNITPAMRQIIVPCGIAFLVIGTTISAAAAFNALPWLSIWVNILSILFNGIGFLIALISLPTNPTPPLAGTTLQNTQTISPSVTPAAGMLPTSAPYRDIRTTPPFIEAKNTQYYKNKVDEIYMKLMRPYSTAVVLSSFDENSRLTVATLLYQEAKKQRAAGKGFFDEEEIWLDIQEDTTLIDLISTLYTARNHSVPLNLNRMNLRYQVMKLIEVLNIAGKYLVIFNQLERLQEDHSEIEECLKALNNHQCRSRILITYRPLRKRSNYFSHFHHYLTLQQIPVLPSTSRIPREPSPADTLYEDMYEKLEDLSRKLVRVFSFYRKAIPLAAAKAHLLPISNQERKKVPFALTELLNIQWLHDDGEKHYYLELAVATHVQEHLLEKDDEQTQKTNFKKEHIQAAKYYIQRHQSEKRIGHLNTEKAQIILVEAVWHLCHANRQQEAFLLAQRERLFPFFEHRNADIVLELCQLFRPSAGWYPDERIADTIYQYQKRAYNTRENA